MAARQLELSDELRLRDITLHNEVYSQLSRSGSSFSICFHPQAKPHAACTSQLISGWPCLHSVYKVPLDYLSCWGFGRLNPCSLSYGYSLWLYSRGSSILDNRFPVRVVPSHTLQTGENSSLCSLSTRGVYFSVRLDLRGSRGLWACGIGPPASSLPEADGLPFGWGFCWSSWLQGVTWQAPQSRWLSFCTVLLFLCTQPPCHSFCQSPNPFSPSLEDSGFFLILKFLHWSHLIPNSILIIFIPSVCL